MARGPRKTIEDRIREKTELIESLKIRIQSEEKELAQLRQEKKMKELEAITDFLDDTGISAAQAREVLERHMSELQEQVQEAV